MTDTVTDDDIILACSIAVSMAEAARYCELPFSSFKRKAVSLGVYKTNQGGQGIAKNRSSNKIPLQEILSGLHPQYHTYKLKHRLYEEGILEPICISCGLGSVWNGSHIEHHLDHINGDSSDHTLNNLRILCPNCHSQTDTYTGKNKGNGRTQI